MTVLRLRKEQECDEDSVGRRSQFVAQSVFLEWDSRREADELRWCMGCPKELVTRKVQMLPINGLSLQARSRCQLQDEA